MRRRLTTTIRYTCLCASALLALLAILSTTFESVSIAAPHPQTASGSPDCDQNGVPDECDIDCAAQGGTCTAFPQCGQATDCNGNTVPDECDLLGSDASPFANGMSVPEDLAPSQGVFPSGYFVPDALTGIIYNVSADGATVQPFATGFDTPVGAVFVQHAFGGQGDRLFVADVATENPAAPDLLWVNSSGQVTPFLELPADTVTGLAYVPLYGVDVISWKLLVTAQSDVNGEFLGSIYLVASTGNVTTLFGSVGTQVFTPALAPVEFGNLGGRVFMGDANGDDILSLDVQARNLELFATVPREPGQIGLRQIAFSPPGWFDPIAPGAAGESLMVLSVTGSQSGGGTNGAVLALDSTGRLVGAIAEQREGLFLDPRGLLFVGDDLLISNAATGTILRATINDFSTPDCNQNSVPDACDISDLTSADCDANGVPDECDPDCNNNSVADTCDIADLTSQDCNENRIPDECETDCNRNGIPDSCDISDGSSLDQDGNGVPDDCEVLFVDPSATGADNGSRWTDAFVHLQDALVAATVTGVVNEIRVAQGLYQPDLGAGQIVGSRRASFKLINGVAIYGGFPAGGGDGSFLARDPYLYETVLSGDLLGDDPSSCCEERLTPGCDDRSCQTSVCSGDALCCTDAWTESCVTMAVDVCSLCTGGGTGENSYHVVTASGVDSSARLDGFTITGGFADGVGQDGHGGGVLTVAGGPTIVRCTLSDNSAMFGGGIANLTGSTSTIIDSLIVRNVGIQEGGGIYNTNSTPLIANTILSGNSTSTGSGGAIYNGPSNPVMTQCTVTANVAAAEGGGLFNDLGSSPTVTNCIFWANRDSGPRDESAQIDSAQGFPGGPRVTYCLIEGLDNFGASPGNIGADPRFTDLNGQDGIPGTRDDDVHVSATSPVIDAGDTTALPADAADLDRDGDQAEMLPFDLDGNPRSLDIPAIPDTGIASPDVVDMGVYEVQPNPPAHDDCSQCIPLVTEAVYDGSSAGASGTDISSCALKDTADVWHCWTADCTGEVLISLCGSLFNTTLSVYDGCGGVELQCDDDGCINGPTQSELHLSVTQGTTYYLRVSGHAGEVGDYSIRVSSCAEACCVANGGCTEVSSPDCLLEGGISLGPGTLCLGDGNNHNGTDDACEDLRGACCLGNGACVDILTSQCLATGGAFQGITSTCDTVTCPEPAGACCVGTTCFENVTRIPCEGLGGLWGGSETSCADYSCPPLPRNACLDATPIGGEGDFPFDTTIATTDGLPAAACDFSGEPQIARDVWYCWTAPCTAIVEVASCDLATMDTRIAVYKGCDDCPPDESVLLACNDNGCGTASLQASASFSAQGGRRYLIRVGSFPATPPGAGEIRIECGHSACPGTGGCCDLEGTSSPGCDDGTCCDAVCACDAFCCEVEWDIGCATTGFENNGCGAQLLCQDTCNPCGDLEAGDCCGDTGSPSCSDLTCCEAVCACDPFCCNVLWDESCAGAGTDGSGCGASVLCDTLCDTDCNSNGIPDPCDIDCGPADGLCETLFGSCGQSTDCNRNNIPDECEPDCNANGTADPCDIAQCSPFHPDYPGCEDCNLNGRPDQCDIESEDSLDVDFDGIPDECARTTGTGATDSWSDGSNWNLGGQFPGDTPEGLFSVTLQGPGADLLLDVDTRINSLRLQAGSQLRVTQTGLEGNLSVTGTGGIVSQGALLISGDRTIDASTGPMLVQDGGKFIPDPSATQPISASLTVRSLKLLPTNFCQPEQLTVADDMSVTLLGDLFMDGRNSMVCPIGRSMQNSILGGRTPPTIRITTTGVLAIAGRLSLWGTTSVYVSNEDDPPGPEPTVQLGGDFDNRSQFPSLFDWVGGKLVMDGSEPQTFEVAGIDLGPTLEGFWTDADAISDTEPHTNFAMGILEIAAGRNVQFVNHFANTVGTENCDEALYIRDLVLGDSSTITLNQCRVYYGKIHQGTGATITSTGCGALIPLCTLDPPMAEPNNMTRNRYLAFVGGNANRISAVRVTFVALPPPFDILNDYALWVGQPNAVSEISGRNDTTPPTLWVGTLECDPYYTDWSKYGIVHITNEAIVPGGRYDLQTISQGCSAGVENNYSLPLQRTMSRWGDVAGAFVNGAWTLPNGSVDVATDVVALLDKFSGRPGAPSKSRTDLEPAVPNGIVNISDVTVALDAFGGTAYPFTANIVPPSCPCLPGLDCDGDTVCDPQDNCSTVPNLNQADTDEDGYGDACDARFDQDHDGDVDKSDLVGLVECLSGPGITANSTCIDSYTGRTDTDVDLEDFASFQRGYTSAISSPCP